MEKMLCMSVDESEEAASSSTDSEILPQLKDKLEISTKRSEQAHILTVLPESWNVREIDFGASHYMVRKPKGILSVPNPKPGKMLEDNMKFVPGC
jgi:hypothetical protein